jgi:hypothetical protein
MKKFCTMFTVCFLSFFAPSAFATSYVMVFDGIEDFGNGQSSAGPSCPCDLDANAVDCLDDEFWVDAIETIEWEDGICYDEFAPEDSKGWVHGRRFVRAKTSE